MFAPLRLAGDAFVVESIEAHARLSNVGTDVTLRVHLRNRRDAVAIADLIVPVSPAFIPAADTPAAHVDAAQTGAVLRESAIAAGDPGPLALAGARLVRLPSVEVPARGTRTITLELAGPPADERPLHIVRGVSIERSSPAWRVTAEPGPGVAGVYSPTHPVGPCPIATRAGLPGPVVIDADGPGCIALAALGVVDGDDAAGLGAGVFLDPDPTVGAGEGGHFVLVLQPRHMDTLCGEPTPREFTLLIDRSGSLRGHALRSVKEAALGVLARVRPEETINIIDFADEPRRLWDAPVAAAPERIAAAAQHILSLEPHGKANVVPALESALHQPATDGALGIVVLITDGLATRRLDGHGSLAEATRAANTGHRRVFPVGIGDHVNAPLLDSIAGATGGASSYVLPGESIAAVLDRLVTRLDGPVLANPTVRVVRGGVIDLESRAPHDTFAGERLVLAGRYVRDEPIELEIAADFLGEQRRWRFIATPSGATRGCSSIGRIWATRHAAALIDQARACGAPGRGVMTVGRRSEQSRCAGLAADAMVDLAARFGVLTEYTAPLAIQNVAWHDAGEVVRDALVRRAVHARRGVAGITQARNLDDCRHAEHASVMSRYTTADLRPAQVTSVLALGEGVVWRRVGSWGVRWVDSALLGSERLEPDRIVPFGSRAHLALATELAASGRAGLLGLAGDIYLSVDGERVLVRGRPGG